MSVEGTVENTVAARVQLATARARTLQYLLPGYLLVAVGGLVTELRVLRLVEKLRHGVRIDEVALETASGSADVADWVAVGVFVLVAAYFLRWVYAAARAAQALLPDPPRISPAWAVGWYFVPLFSVWKPFLAMHEIAWRSEAAANQGQGDARVGKVLPAWWIFWLLVNVTGFVGARLFVVAGDPVLVSVGVLLSAIGEGLKLVLGWLLIRLVGRIVFLQERALEHARS